MVIEVDFHKNALKELKKAPKSVVIKMYALLTALENVGYLTEPEAKKISARLFELRVKDVSQWRGLYTYVQGKVLVLAFFVKKTQKTPLKELETALKRLKN